MEPCLFTTAAASDSPRSAAWALARFRAFMRQEAPPSPTVASDSAGGSAALAGKLTCSIAGLTNLTCCEAQSAHVLQQHGMRHRAGQVGRLAAPVQGSRTANEHLWRQGSTGFELSPAGVSVGLSAPKPGRPKGLSRAVVIQSSLCTAGAAGCVACGTAVLAAAASALGARCTSLCASAAAVCTVWFASEVQLASQAHHRPHLGCYQALGSYLQLGQQPVPPCAPALSLVRQRCLAAAPL